MFIGHFDHASENVVCYQLYQIINTSYAFWSNEVTGTNTSMTIANESCLNACLGVGGDVSVVFCGMSNSNNVAFLKALV